MFSFLCPKLKNVLKLQICFLFYLNFTLIANANFLLHDEEYTRQLNIKQKKSPVHNEYARHKHRKG